MQCTATLYTHVLVSSLQSRLIFVMFYTIACFVVIFGISKLVTLYIDVKPLKLMIMLHV